MPLSWPGLGFSCSGVPDPPRDGATQDETASRRPARQAAEVYEVYQFDSLAQMVATSDAVVVATAVQERPGRTTGDEGDAILHEQVTFRVDTLLFGKAMGEQVAVETISGFAADGTTTSPPAGYVDFDEGDRAVLFLWHHADTKARYDEPLYTYVNSQGAYKLQGNDVADLARPEDSLVDSIQAMAAPELITGIQQATTAIAQGEVRPLPRP